MRILLEDIYLSVVGQFEYEVTKLMSRQIQKHFPLYWMRLLIFKLFLVLRYSHDNKIK